MVTGNYPDNYGATKLPAVTGPPMKRRGAPLKKKKHPHAQPMHARMAKAFEKSAGKY